MRSKLAQLRAAVGMGATLIVVALSVPAAFGGTPRVPADYFGVNLHNSYSMTPEVRAAHAAAIARTGMTQVRLPIAWSMIEPDPPRQGIHTYRWDKVDVQMAALARAGLTAQALFAYAPPWASNATPEEAQECRNRGAAGLAAGTPLGYAAAARALAERYGVGGSFWAQNPELTPQPVRLYEIWNAPNTAGAWCPQVDPEGYGILFAHAEQAIRAFDPAAEVVVGGFGIGARTQYGSVATLEFIQRMVSARPSIRQTASAIGLHLYPGKELERQLDGLRTFRNWLRRTGFADSMPILLNEIGFSRAGAIDMTEDERVASYVNVTSKLPRTDCNVSGVVQYTWTTRDYDTTDAEDMFGIAKIPTAELYPSGEAYVYWVRRFRGELVQEAPTEPVPLCAPDPPPPSGGGGGGCGALQKLFRRC